GGKNQLRRPPVRHFRPRNLNQLAPARQFPLKRLRGFEREDLLPGFGGGDNRECFAVAKRRPEKAGTPQWPAALVGAALFDAIEDRLETASLENESGLGAIQPKAKRRYLAVRSDFVAISESANGIRLVQRQGNRGFVFAEMHRRSKPEPDHAVVAQIA